MTDVQSDSRKLGHSVYVCGKGGAGPGLSEFTAFFLFSQLGFLEGPIEGVVSIKVIMGSVERAEC